MLERIRPLGIPTVSDRIAQMVVKRYLEPILESVFHKDSYGYRPGKSAHDALVVARRRCWDHDWVLDLDIKSFSDEIDCGACHGKQEPRPSQQRSSALNLPWRRPYPPPQKMAWHFGAIRISPSFSGTS